MKTPTETADFIARYNAWRRGGGSVDEIADIQIGQTLDDAVRMLQELHAAHAYIAALEGVCDGWQLRHAQANIAQLKQPPTSAQAATCGNESRK